MLFQAQSEDDDAGPDDVAVNMDQHDGYMEEFFNEVLPLLRIFLCFPCVEVKSAGLPSAPNNPLTSTRLALLILLFRSLKHRLIIIVLERFADGSRSHRYEMNECMDDG